MKFKKIFLSTLTTFALLPIALVSEKQNIETNLLKKYADTISYVQNTINRFFSTNEKINYVKKINGDFLLFQYDNYFAIIDKNDNKIVEIKKGHIRKNKNYVYELLGDRTNSGNISDSDIKPASINENSFSPDSSDTLDKLPKISHMIRDAWWWASRDTQKRVGYTTQDRLYDKYNKNGLCEYVAIANLLLYNELFKTSGLFNATEMNDYFDYEGEDDSELKRSSPTFRFYDDDNPDLSLVADLWRSNNRRTDIYSYKSYYRAIKNFVKNKNVLKKYDFEYKLGSYYWRTVENIKNNNPVIVSTYKTYHSFIVYGYDEKSEMLLLNWLWGLNDSIVLVHYSKLSNSGSIGKIIFTMKPKKEYENDTKRHFRYKMKLYNGKEVGEMLNEK
ncbi:hypothetical protein PUW86_02195 [Metamycoplasma hyosynoviae]|uniref:putative cysteine peptidase n=1 Tax=Metamycoplasma hyosynoviae TaxID=29559 RepID=UPI002365956D|nr:hypothetical protein [Metamycoplasma hyosynoviae]MDD7837797.1 hypothetical protein [Metamycoplasma hyosynoviae]